MLRSYAWMLAALLVIGTAIGCKKKADEPVSVVPDDNVPIFPEDQVPPPEPQPVASPAIAPVSPPVDTTASASPTATQQPKESYASSASGQTYVVKKGDTLQAISRKHYHDNGQGWRRIFEANRELLAKGPDHIAPGMKLVIP